jgi:hypothetical protein
MFGSEPFRAGAVVAIVTGLAYFSIQGSSAGVPRGREKWRWTVELEGVALDAATVAEARTGGGPDHFGERPQHRLSSVAATPLPKTP